MINHRNSSGASLSRMPRFLKAQCGTPFEMAPTQLNKGVHVREQRESVYRCMCERKLIHFETDVDPKELYFCGYVTKELFPNIPLGFSYLP